MAETDRSVRDEVHWTVLSQVGEVDGCQQADNRDNTRARARVSKVREKRVLEEENLDMKDKLYRFVAAHLPKRVAYWSAMKIHEEFVAKHPAIKHGRVTILTALKEL